VAVKYFRTGPTPGVKRQEREAIYLRLVSRLRMRGAIPSLRNTSSR